METWTSFALSLLEITWINILLSGDNAVVIALACRALPADKQRIGVTLGAGAAIVLRLIFTVIVVTLLTLPFVKIIGAVLLLWIAIKLVLDDNTPHDVTAATSVWSAVRTIAVADAVMSLDNVIAIAAAARNSLVLIGFGLLLSVPLIIFGATLILRVIERFSWLVWVGAALLGWVAGEMGESEPRLHDWAQTQVAHPDVWGGLIGIVIVLAVAGLVRWRRTR